MVLKEKKKLKRQSKPTKGVIIGIVVLMVILLGVWAGYFLTRPLEKKELPVSFIVSDSVGFDLNKTALTFGMMPPGSSSTRGVAFRNDFDFPVRVDVFVSKSLLRYLNSESNFRLDAGESKNVTFTLRVPGDADEGNYSGQVRFEMRKV